MKITTKLGRTLKAALGKDWRRKVLRGDFSDADFRGANFRGADFRGADFRGADFRGADFRGADFSGADFRCANFRGADFSGADFSENLKVIWLIMLANACVYPLTITIPIVEEAAKKTDEWKQGKPPIERGDACESGWAKAFGSAAYLIEGNETHAFWYFCWRAAQ